MDIYVVQEGDNVISIAEKYGVSVDRVILDNGLEYPYNLVIGQSIVIVYPKQIHLVQPGDSLQSIAQLYNITVMQILRNNSFLSDREYLYEGELLVISYYTTGKITTNGIAYPYIRKETLLKILPSLTYLSIFNYTIIDKGEITSYQEDSEIIQISKVYGVIPLVMITTLTQYGEPNIENAYNILMSDKYQERMIELFISIMKNKGYKGVNVVLNYLSEVNQLLYEVFVQRISARLQQEDFLLFITINYKSQEKDNTFVLEQIDYSKLEVYVNGIIFLNFVWGTNYGPPAPVGNISDIKAIVNYVTSSNVSPEKIVVGKPIIGYDWQLPYVPGRSSASSLTIDSVYNLVYNVNTIIQFDDNSQTPFFYYKQFNLSILLDHVVWFIDARSIKALNDLIRDYNLNGSGIWNIMIYHPQLWIVINSQFEILKLLDDN